MPKAIKGILTIISNQNTDCIMKHHKQEFWITINEHFVNKHHKMQDICSELDFIASNGAYLQSIN